MAAGTGQPPTRRRLKAWVYYAVIACVVLLALPGFAPASPGDLDPNFGNGTGTVATDYGHVAAADVAVQSDGKIVVVGNSTSGLVLVRYNENGTLDTSFGGGDGAVTGSVPGSAIYLEPSGKILIGGIEPNMAVLSRFNSNGSIDTSYGAGTGTVRTVFGTSEDRAYTAAFGPGGTLYLVGECSREFEGFPTSQFAIAAYNPNGSLDTAFDGPSGIVHEDFGVHFAVALSVAVQPDGKVLVGGTNSADLSVARFNPNGTLDTSFGSGGQAVTEASSSGGKVWALAVQPDGKIVAAGEEGQLLTLIRYDEDGSPDTTFGSGDGVVHTFAQGDFGAGLETGILPYALALEPSGRIVVSGGLYNFWDGTFGTLLVRYNPNGALDRSFGSDGIATTPGGSTAALQSLILQPDGKIVAVGGSGSPNVDFIVQRYLGGGAPVPAYNRLNVTKAGGGSGNVYGGGVSCGTECIANVEAGETVTLEAVPDNGSEFAGWSGACTGPGDCKVVMSDNKAITATFTPTAAEAPSGEEAEGGSPGGPESSANEGGGNPGGGSSSSPPPSTSTAIPVIPSKSAQARRPKHKPLKCHRHFAKRRVQGKAKCIRVGKKRHGHGQRRRRH